MEKKKVKKKKLPRKFIFFSFFTFVLLLSPLIFAYDEYGWNRWNRWDTYQFSPSRFLENEWVIFGGIFLIVFSIVYASLQSFFTKKSGDPNFPWKEVVKKNKAIPAVLAGIIAFFVASAVIRNEMIRNYFGDFVSSVGMIILFVILFLLLIPFYKTLKRSIGSGALLLVLLVGWLVLRLINLPEILPYSPYYDIETLIEIYYFLSSYLALGIAIIIGVIFLVSSRKSNP